jgi:hypothetical protein
MFCRPLPTRTTAAQVFQMLSDFMSEVEISLQNCAGICTDGERSMTGRNSGLVARIKEVAPMAKWIHCSIHREALATKKISLRLKNVLDSAVKIVNFIKARPLNSRIFSELCKEMGSNHEQLLLHTEVRWLSRGKVLTRLFELREEVQIFFNEHPFEYSVCLSDQVWISNLAYLGDIFSRLNDLNKGLQGNVTIFDVCDKISAMMKKLNWFQSCVSRGDLSSFPTLDKFLKDNLSLDNTIKKIIEEHLIKMHQQFSVYFPEGMLDDSQWVH